MVTGFRCKWVNELIGTTVRSGCYTYALTREDLEKFIFDMNKSKAWSYRAENVEEIKIDPDMADKLKFSKVRHLIIG